MHRLRRLTTPLLVLLVLGLASGVGCQSNKRTGPVFEAMTPPGESDSLVYIHRLDALRGVGPLDVHIDGQGVGDLRDKEYLALVLQPGTHRISLRRRWGGFFPLAWSEFEFRSTAGATTNIRVWAGYEHHQSPGTAGSAPGRSDGSTSVSIYASPWDSAKAMLELRGCRRAPGV